MKTKGTIDGFSLVELMVVLAIVAIVTGLAIPKFKDLRAKSFDAKSLTLQKTGFMAANIMIEEAYDNDGIHELWANSYNRSGNNVDSSVSTAGGNIWKSFIGPPEDHPDMFFVFYFDKNCQRSACINNDVRAYLNVGHCKGTEGPNDTIKYFSGTISSTFKVNKSFYFPTKASRGCT